MTLCLVFAASVISFSRHASATFDEVAHLSAGFSYLRWNDYRLNPEHPPLVKKLAALPLMWQTVWPGKSVLLDANAALTAKSADEQALGRAWGLALEDSDKEWPFGRLFLYGVRDDFTPPTTAPPDSAAFFNHADRLLFSARMPVMLLGVGLAVLIFLWSRECFGFWGGVLSLALYCFDPNFIAHSGLVTTDLGVALFIFGAVYFLWRTCSRLNGLNVVLFLAFFGLAFATKFSAALLLPIFWLTVGIWILSPEPWRIGAMAGVGKHSRAFKMWVILGLFAAALLSAYVIIWASYSFRYSAAANPVAAARMEGQILGQNAGATGPARESRILYRQPGHCPIEAAVRGSAAIKMLLAKTPRQVVGDDQVLRVMDQAPLGLSGKLILFAQRYHILPEAFIYGFARADRDSHIRSSFLLGHYSLTGFRTYFFYSFLLKTPLPALILIFAGLVPVLINRARWGSHVIFCLVPVGLYFVGASLAHLDIGLRHLLPIYPFLYVLAGGVARDLGRLRPATRTILFTSIIGWVAVSSRIVFFPAKGSFCQRIGTHYLAYFNELGGGPANGYKELVDSNLDWGQDLKNLKIWLEEHSVKGPVGLCYFGTADPRYYQIAYENLPGGYTFEPLVGFEKLRPGGLVIISATNLQGVYFDPGLRQAWREVLSHCDLVDSVGYSIFIYRFRGFDDHT